MGQVLGVGSWEKIDLAANVGWHLAYPIPSLDPSWEDSLKLT